MTYALNSDGSLTVTGCDPTGATDNSAPIQCAVDYMATTYGGGNIWLPWGGSYLIKSPIVLKNSVTLKGQGRNTLLTAGPNDTGIVVFDSSCSYAGIRDLFIAGFQNAASQTNAVTVARNVPVLIKDCHIWGGNSALYTQGIDGEINNCCIAGWSFASIVSNGANWYERCKIDQGAVPCTYAFYQGTPIPGASSAENHFTDCDFSGSYQSSVMIAEGSANMAVSVFTGCVFSSPINLISANYTSFVGAEFGSPIFNLGTGDASIVGSKSFAPMTVSSRVKLSPSNVNIS
jgi:Pectate lyase superfamily protein